MTYGTSTSSTRPIHHRVGSRTTRQVRPRCPANSAGHWRSSRPTRVARASRDPELTARYVSRKSHSLPRTHRSADNLPLSIPSSKSVYGPSCPGSV